MKILVMGLPGSGKTYLTKRLQPLLGAAWYNADKVRDILIILLMDRADREDRKVNLDNVNREIRPLAVDLVKIWSIQLG